MDSMQQIEDQLDYLRRRNEDFEISLNALLIKCAKQEAAEEQLRFRGKQVDMMVKKYARQYEDWDVFYKHLDEEISFIYQQSSIEDWEICDQLFACPNHAILSDILISLHIDAYTYEDSLILILRYRYSNNNRP